MSNDKDSKKDDGGKFLNIGLFGMSAFDSSKKKIQPDENNSKGAQS